MLSPFLEFRWTDAVDILFVAALVYFAFVWIRQTRAAMVAGGLIILAVVYIAARAMGLQLTAWIFQGFFAIFVIIVVVIFQEELRQLFERLALFSLGRSERRVVSDDAVNILIEGLSDCARDRIGALVVIPGSQPIGRHVRGGIELGGELSVPLLKSIFDPHSPGHDGAMVIDQGRVAQFAVHLPLSADVRQLSGLGTRHSAALGLAELTDALCIVVSEERGRISVAEAGRLRTLAQPQELSDVLRRFLSGRQPGLPRRQRLPQLLFANWLEKLVAAAFVIGLWYVFIPGSRPTQATYPVRVRLMNLPAEFIVDEIVPNTVDVTFTAPARRFYLFDVERVTLTVDASMASSGRRTFQITEQNLSYPKELAVDRIRPTKIKLTLHRQGEPPPTPVPTPGPGP
ncbi:MAG TPA: diadenylate cyclase [Terriglobales bacterium]|nr:diadenylate cyclase [Terriglobales bacterium]